MRPIAFALLLLGATACPTFASSTLIEAKSPTFGCQFSATLGLFQELSTASEEDSNRILDTGHCLPIDAHQRFTVVHDLPSAYVALKDTQQHDQWVVVFVRKSDFHLLQGSPDHQSAGNRHGAKVPAASQGTSPPSRAGAASTGPEATVDKAHHSRTATAERLGAAR